MTDEQRQEIMRLQAESMRAMSKEEMARRQLEESDGARQRGPLSSGEQEAMRNFWRDVTGAMPIMKLTELDLDIMIEAKQMICRADACRQGRDECPVPQACAIDIEPRKPMTPAEALTLCGIMALSGGLAATAAFFIYEWVRPWF